MLKEMLGQSKRESLGSYKKKREYAWMQPLIKEKKYFVKIWECK